MSSVGHRSVTRPDGSTAESWMPYRCGHCGRDVSGAVVAYTQDHTVRWIWCPVCEAGSVANAGMVVPGAIAGPEVEGLPDDVARIYREARQSFAAGAFTACEL